MGAAAGLIGWGVGVGVGAGAAAAAGAAAGAVAGAAAPSFCALQVFRNSCQVWPLVVPAALAAFQSSPHCFITLSALAPLTPVRLRSPATRRADTVAPSKV